MLDELILFISPSVLFWCW